MIFSSVPFLYYFLPAVIILYIIAPKKLKNAALLIASLFFYAWGEKKLVILFMITILCGYILGLLIEKTKDKPYRPVFLWLSVLIDLGLLCYFKYVDFFIDSINKAFNVSIPLLKIALPIGISFYIFQIMSYTIDVYREDVPAQKNLINFAAYVSFFPQLIAGPIVRYADIEKQLVDRETSLVKNYDKVAEGVSRFLVGLAKKVFLANALGELTVVFRATTDSSVLFYWLYAIAYMLQIYFDFSGYSDMAIGLGKVFGFDFIENFDYPYISSSITEFWRRWHISLGSWFRDYVYIPLGGNRKGMARQIINILIVWMLTGLWHGAAWNFVLWGLLYAILLVIEKVGFKKWLDKNKWVGHIYVIFTVMLGFVLFNATDLSQVVTDIKGLFGFMGVPLISAEALYYLRSYAVIFVMAIIGATPLPKKLIEKLSENERANKVLSIVKPLCLTLILVAVTAFLVDGSFNPFLYFRF